VHITGESTKHGETPQIRLPHTVAPGPVRNEDYGLDLARLVLPPRVVNNAERICKFLQDKKARSDTGPTTRVVKQNRLVLALPELLNQALNSSMDDSALASYIEKLQTEFTIRMNLAADDEPKADSHDVNHDQNRENIQPPVLEQPSAEELKEWRKKCDAAERRVMHANMVNSHRERKRRASREEERNEHRHKRTKKNYYEYETESLVGSGFTPINRSSMIAQLSEDTDSSSSSSRAETPISFLMAEWDSDSNDEPLAEEEPMRVTRGDDEAQDAIAASSDTRPRAISISSDSSVDDAEDQTAKGPSRPPSPVPPQPLEAFQPLKAWYDKQGISYTDEIRDADGNWLI
jgi:DNA mismatch repair protein MSH4